MSEVILGIFFGLNQLKTNIFIHVCSENEESRTAYVTFKDTQGADTAVLLTVVYHLCFRKIQKLLLYSEY